MSDGSKTFHIVDASSLDAIHQRQEGDYLLFRTNSWMALEAPGDPSVLAIFAQTPAGVIGLEFPKTEATELARQLAAMTTTKSGGKH